MPELLRTSHNESRDAIFPSFSRFPDFLSVQYENKVHFSLFQIANFIFESIPRLTLDILNAKIKELRIDYCDQQAVY